jgi:hypothetical protein
LHGCETWSLSLREEHKSKVFENKVMIFGPNREEVEGGWRRLHFEELHNFHASPGIIRAMKSTLPMDHT